MHNIKKVREVVAMGNMNGRVLRLTLKRVEELIVAGREDLAREYVAKISKKVRAGII